jgi:hypothetical protein
MKFSTKPQSADPRGAAWPPITAQRRSAAFEGGHPAGAPPIDPGPRRQQRCIHDHRRIGAKTIALSAVLALSAVPALAMPAQVPSNQGTAHIPNNQATQHALANPGPPAAAAAKKPSPPGPAASAKAKGKAYGKYCADQSKKHVAGQHGTPFSKCVSAAAKLLGDQG